MVVDCIGFGNQLLPCGVETLPRQKPCEAWSLSLVPMMVILGVFRDGSEFAIVNFRGAGGCSVASGDNASAA